MGRRSRVLLICFGSLGFPIAAFGAWYWWLLDAVTATDRQPFLVAKALVVIGCLMIVVTLILAKERDV